jgi:hypothetical protein
LVVAAGVFTAFFIKFMKIGIELRGSALEALERAENAAILARSEGKTFGSFRDGELEWLSAKTHLDNGRYRLARRRFERAISYYNAATATAPAVVQDLDPQRQPLTNQQISNIADQARSRGLIRLGLRDFDNIVFILSSVVLAIIIMQVWNQIYSQLQALSVGGLWFITAFLLGFGSESLVGEAIEVTRIGQRR